VEFRNTADGGVIGASTLFSEPFPTGGSSVSWTPTISGQVFVRVLNNSGLQQNIDLILIETTLASPWYFVSAAQAYETFAEIRNHTSGSVSVTLRAYDFDGAVVGSTTFSMSPNTSRYVRVGADLGVVSGAGSLTITHNGMPGAIVANATALSPLSGLSFDAPFTARMSWSTFSGED
jgi:hypothetical protein